MYLRLTKSGSTSISDVLRYYSDELTKGHISLSEAIEIYPESKDYLIIGFVRNPYDFIISLYNHQYINYLEGRRSNFINTVFDYYSFKNPKGFALWIKDNENILKNYQHRFYEGFEFYNVKILKFENIVSEFEIIRDIVQIPEHIELKKLNSKQSNKVKEFILTNKNVDRINKLCYKDFQDFNYKAEV